MRKSNFEADTNMTDMVCDFLIGIAVVILSYLFFWQKWGVFPLFLLWFCIFRYFYLRKKGRRLV